jgi:hypothetical protein
MEGLNPVYKTEVLGFRESDGSFEKDVWFSVVECEQDGKEGYQIVHNSTPFFGCDDVSEEGSFFVPATLEEAKKLADEKLEEAVRVCPDRYLGRLRVEIKREYDQRFFEEMSEVVGKEIEDGREPNMYDLLTRDNTPDVNKRILDVYWNHQKRLGLKLYHSWNLLSFLSDEFNKTVLGFNFEVPDFNPDQLYEEAMNDKNYQSALYVAREFDLPAAKKELTVLKMAEHELEIANRLPAYITPGFLEFQYEDVKEELGFKHPVAKKVAERRFDGLMKDRKYKSALEVAEEAGLGERCAAEAEWKIKPVRKFIATAVNLLRGEKVRPSVLGLVRS